MSSDEIEVHDRRRPGFYMIDNEINEVYAQRIGAYGLAVYGAVCFRVGRRGACTASCATIARDAGGCTERTVRDTLDALEGEGLISIERVAGKPHRITIEPVVKLEKYVGTPEPRSGVPRNHVPTTPEPRSDEQDVINNTLQQEGTRRADGAAASGGKVLSDDRLMFRTLCETYGLKPSGVTAAFRGRFNRAIASWRAQGVGPDDLEEAVQLYRETWKGQNGSAPSQGDLDLAISQARSGARAHASEVQATGGIISGDFPVAREETIAEAVWHEVMELVVASGLPARTRDQYLVPLRARSYYNGRLLVAAPTASVAAFVNDRILAEICAAGRAMGVEDVQVAAPAA